MRNNFDVLTFLIVISESAGDGVDPENKEKGEYRSEDVMQKLGAQRNKTRITNKYVLQFYTFHL